MSNKKIGKTPRRLLTASMSFVLLAALSSCSGTNNGVGDEKVYAKVGSGDQLIEVTNKDLWNEFQWSSNTVLKGQIENVVLNKQIERIRVVLSKEWKDLSEDDKQLLVIKNDDDETIYEVTKEEDYNDLVKNYKDRLVDYVVQDIYNLEFSIDNYWDDVKELTKSTEKKLRLSYADELYTSYQISGIGDLIQNAGEENYDNYYKVAQMCSELYIPLLAKELAVKDEQIKKVAKALEEDEDPDDSMNGTYSYSQYVSKFKSEYVNKFDINAVLIRFTSDTEFTETLRAFGLKIVDKEYYFLDSNALNLKSDATYDAYVKAYKDITNDEVKNKGYNISKRMPHMLLDIYVQMYNYVYGGYRETLTTNGFDFDFNDLNQLRKDVEKIIEAYQTKTVEEAKEFYNQSKKLLTDNNNELILKHRKDLDDIESTLSSFLYDTVKLDQASTSSQGANGSYYAAFKFAEFNQDDQFKDVYKSSLTNDEIYKDIIAKKDENGNYIYKDENGKSVFDHIEDLLLKDAVTTTAITNTVSDYVKNAEVKIYNEACEITYSKDNSSYTKTRGSAGDNVLATIKYNDETFALNINANGDSENPVTYVSYNDTTKVYEKKPFGVFDYMEKSSGATTAIDIISNKVIKTTAAYEKTNEDRDTFKQYIKYLLYNFANDGFSSSGYPASIGKYNFLMLYFHSANIDNIIDDFYRVQYASSNLLTDYNKLTNTENPDLSNFFKTYVDKIYDNYFSMGGTRLVVYFDKDEDNKEDEVKDWKNNVVKFNGQDETLGNIAKQLVMDVYSEISSKPESHVESLNSIVTEINESARAEYKNNPIAVENKWSKYRKVGLNVKTAEFTVTNTTTTEDINLKERLYQYYTDESYNYFLNDTAPTEFIEKLDEEKIVETKDGYNLIIVTTGSAKPSAKWTEKDNKDGLLENIYIEYNKEVIKVADNIYNENDRLTLDQIRLYVLDYSSNGSSTLSPSSLTDALTTFLNPVYSRFTSSETQRIILLNFIKNRVKSDKSINDLLEFGSDYSKEDGYLGKIISINQNIADDYVSMVYEDDKYVDNYGNWWNEITKLVDKILFEEGQAK